MITKLARTRRCPPALEISCRQPAQHQVREGQRRCGTGVQAEAACEAWSPGSLPEPRLLATVLPCAVSDLQLRVTESAPCVSSLTPHPRTHSAGAFNGPVLQMGTQRSQEWERALKGPERPGRHLVAGGGGDSSPSLGKSYGALQGSQQVALLGASRGHQGSRKRPLRSLVCMSR